MSRAALRIAAVATVAVWGLISLGAAAQAPQSAGNAKPPATRSAPAARPLWSELSPGQREALAPLSSKWDGYSAERKQKWLEVAAKYPNLAPDGKQRLHERMAEFAQLSPQQRETLRENFRKAYELPADQRQAVLQQYKDLPPDQRKALTEQASKKAEPPRRPARDLSGDRSGKAGGDRRSEPAPAGR